MTVSFYKAKPMMDDNVFSKVSYQLHVLNDIRLDNANLSRQYLGHTCFEI